MRSIIALALLSRALALPHTFTQDTTVASRDSDNDSGLAFVDLNDFQAVCQQLKEMGADNERCNNVQAMSAPDLCRSSATSAPKIGSHMPKLALSRLGPASSDEGDATSDDDITDDKATLRKIPAALKLKNPVADSGSTADNGDDESASALDDLVDCDCDSASPTSTESESASASVAISVTATESAASTQTLAARKLDFLSATRLASLAVTATRAATSSESASPTGLVRSGADSSSFDLNGLMTSVENGSSKNANGIAARDLEDSATNIESLEMTSSESSTSSTPASTQTLAARGLDDISASQLASLAVTATRAAAASPTGYTGFVDDFGSIDFDSLSYAADLYKEGEDENDMPTYV